MPSPVQIFFMTALRIYVKYRQKRAPEQGVA
jgi:hypothetical protein